MLTVCIIPSMVASAEEASGELLGTYAIKPNNDMYQVEAGYGAPYWTTFEGETVVLFHYDATKYSNSGTLTANNEKVSYTADEYYRVDVRVKLINYHILIIVLRNFFIIIL